MCVTAPRVKTIFFCTAHSVPCPHAGGQRHRVLMSISECVLTQAAFLTSGELNAV